MNIKPFIFIGCMAFTAHEVIAQEYSHHSKHNQVRLFQTGQAATTGQATFSEDGFSGVLTQELRDNPDVYSGPGMQCRLNATQRIPCRAYLGAW